MKTPALLILASALAFSAAAVAQTAEQPVMKTKWSLEKVNAKKAAQAAPAKAGPAVPPPMQVKVPRKVAPPRARVAQGKSNRVNATPLIAGIARRTSKD